METRLSNQEMKDQVVEAVNFYMDLARDIYGINIDNATTQFNVRGKVAGKASYANWLVKFNPIILFENFDKMMDQTVPHEVAHLVAYNICGGRPKPHGREWKSVMRAFGKSPDRCHSYDVTNATVRRSGPKKRYVYECTGCGAQITVGPTRDRRWHTGTPYTTKCCKALIRPVQKDLITA